MLPEVIVQGSFQRNPGEPLLHLLLLGSLLISYLFHWDSPDNIGQGMLKNTFLMAGIASAVLGLFSFTLPKTPPTRKAGEKISFGEIIGLDALKLLKNKNFAVFFLSSILICIPLAFYYQNTNLFLTNI